MELYKNPKFKQTNQPKYYISKKRIKQRRHLLDQLVSAKQSSFIETLNKNTKEECININYKLLKSDRDEKRGDFKFPLVQSIDTWDYK